jgi:DNA replication protein DnaC
MTHDMTSFMTGLERMIEAAPEHPIIQVEPKSAEAYDPAKRAKPKGFPEWFPDAPAPTGEKWADGFKRSMPIIEAGGIAVFFGGRGTGKTRMAYELSKHAKLPKTTFGGKSSAYRPIICTTAMRLFLRLRDSFRKNAESSELQIIDEMSGAALLVLDEFQERGETDFENQKITHIIDARYSAGLPTILIANLTRAEFAEKMSDSVKDRIAENGGGVHFDWGSYRRGKSA